jgi:H+/Cl- antiporter ClcA
VAEADVKVAQVTSETWRRLAAQVVPAAVVGVGSAMALLLLSEIAGHLEHLIWTDLPGTLHVSPDSPGWIIGVLALTGVAVALVVTFVPGHAGPDPATLQLTGAPLPINVLPSLAIAIVLALAGGVSLGPENPIIGITVGLSIAVGTRLLPRVGSAGWAAWAVSGTLGAMFGTPVAAALMLSEVSVDSSVPLWDRMFGPLVAAGAGAVTMDLLHAESFSISVAPYPGPQMIDLVSACVIAAATALVGVVAVHAYPRLYRLFQRMGPPLLTIIVGGVVLGLLGAIGGRITLFKGLDEMKQLSATAASYTATGLAFVGVIKLIAMLVAATSGFRGGRIFPAVFVGVAFGLAISAFVPTVPQSLAVGASLLGILLAVTRSGWLSLFMAALMVGEAQVLPILCIAILPAWLLVTDQPLMVITSRSASPVPVSSGAH